MFSMLTNDCLSTYKHTKLVSNTNTLLPNHFHSCHMLRETGLHECLSGSQWSSPSPQDAKVRPGEGEVGERLVQPICAGPKREESQTQRPAEKSQRAGGIC